MNYPAAWLALLALLSSTGAVVAGEPPASPWRALEDAAFPLVRLSVGNGFDAASTESELAARLAAASPLSLAACDLDGDGMPDVVAGWATPDGGLVTLHRGNVDLLWPNTPGALQRRAEGRPVDAPFLPDVAVLDLGLRPDLLGCGHLDGDGKPDLVAARLGGDRLELLLGDGRGGVARSTTRELRDPVTALAVGEVNRRDGLDDLVVGVGSGATARLLVLEGPAGAATADPETLVAPGTVRSIALGHFDGDSLLDLAAAAGSEVVVVHGRDRKLSLDDARRLAVPAAKLGRIAVGETVESLTAVDLEGRGFPALAAVTTDGELLLLDPRDPTAAPVRVRGLDPRSLRGSRLVATRSFGHHGHDLLVVDRRGGRLVAVPADGLAAAKRGEAASPSPLELAGEPLAVLPMRLNPDGLDDLAVLTAGPPELGVVLVSPLAAWVVNTGGYYPDDCSTYWDYDDNPGDGVCSTPGGGCTLPAALQEASETPGPDTITFTAQPNPNGCDWVTPQAGHGALTIDGTSFPGLWLARVYFVDQGSVVRGAEVLDLLVWGQADGAVVEGCTIHEGRLSTSNNTVGGTVVQARNVLGGITFEGGPVTGNLVRGNWVGTEDGTTSSGGGITVGSYQEIHDTRIGGVESTMRNLISGGGGVGLGPFSEGGLVQGNYIGTDASGTAALGNTTGVDVKAPGNTVGGTTPATRNVIGAGHTGVRVYDSAGDPEVLIQGNYIGTNASGAVPLGFDSAGVELTLASNVVVGGVVAGAGNVISACSPSSVQGAVWVRGPNAANNDILGNSIGTNASGTAAFANYRGIRVYDADLTTIGGTVGTTAGGPCTGACNLISASAQEAVYVSNGSTGTVIAGNYIGTDRNGTGALPNQSGIRLDNAWATTIGGTQDVMPQGPCSGACNLISASTAGGVSLANGTTGTEVSGNFIGTDVTGTSPLGNAATGVTISSSPDNTVGGDMLEARNVIAASGTMGIRLSGATTTGNVIRRNLIGLGADGETVMGSFYYGISIASSAAFNTFGGLDPEQGNVVTGSGYTGIRAEGTAGHGNAFLSNALWDNAYLGIDIGAPGVDTNDPGDVDDGANGLQNYPVLTQVLFLPSGITFLGALDSAPSTTYRVQVFANRSCNSYYGYGEGEQLLGTQTVTTGADGHVELSMSFPGAIAHGQQFTATATDPDGNTSEFSACLAGPAGVDVGLRKLAPGSAAPGDLVEFRIPVENHGNVIASNATVSDPLDPCLTEIVCTTTQGTCQVTGSNATVTIGDVAPLGEVLVIITARVGGSCPVDLVNTANAQAAGDVNPGNDSATSHTRLDAVFGDDFESGDTSEWSNAVP